MAAKTLFHFTTAIAILQDAANALKHTGEKIPNYTPLNFEVPLSEWWLTIKFKKKKCCASPASRCM